MSTNVVVYGAAGRMGREISFYALQDDDIALIGGVDAPQHPDQGRDIGELCSAGACGVKLTGSLDELPLDDAVIIDFTFPTVSMGLLDSLTSRKTRIVSGTTGLDKSQQERLKSETGSKAILWSPNMSLGVNLLFHLTKQAAQALQDGYDIEIVEAHHRRKKDAPSGTAQRLGEVAAAARNLQYDEVVRHGRSGMTGERTKDEIGMHAVRGGGVIGDHLVLFAGESERLEIRHAAQDRSVFAKGALAAAKWLSGREPGLYSMADMLGF